MSLRHGTWGDSWVSASFLPKTGTTAGLVTQVRLPYDNFFLTADSGSIRLPRLLLGLGMGVSLWDGRGGGWERALTSTISRASGSSGSLPCRPRIGNGQDGSLGTSRVAPKPPSPFPGTMPAGEGNCLLAAGSRPRSVREGFFYQSLSLGRARELCLQPGMGISREGGERERRGKRSRGGPDIQPPTTHRKLLKALFIAFGLDNADGQ